MLIPMKAMEAVSSKFVSKLDDIGHGGDDASENDRRGEGRD